MTFTPPVAARTLGQGLDAKGRHLMFWRLTLVSLLAGSIALIVACAGAPNIASTDEYQVLEQLGPAGHISLFLLVDEKMPKEDVMKIAKRFWDRGDLVMLVIYDARAAYDSDKKVMSTGQDDPSYPEKEFKRHCLLKCVAPVDKQVSWIAEGRDH